MTNAPTITVIDYGMGNLFSVKQAIEYCGANVIYAKTACEINDAKILVLPGVGAFSDGMQALRDQSIIEAIASNVKSGKPLLGICLGMQMLFESSQEFGHCDGLGLIPGKVLSIPNEGKQKGKNRKIPHIGWGQLETSSKYFKNNSYMYFVHSYYVEPTDKSTITASCTYDDFNFCAAIEYKNIIAVQFHPERSGKNGLEFLQNFIQRYCC